MLGPGGASGFFAYVTEGMPQGDYASAGQPVTKACDELLQAQAATVMSTDCCTDVLTVADVLTVGTVVNVALMH